MRSWHKLTCCLLTGTEENHGKPQHSRFTGRDSNRVHSVYKSGELGDVIIVTTFGERPNYDAARHAVFSVFLSLLLNPSAPYDTIKYR
jgi:hypothetical protein